MKISTFALSLVVMTCAFTQARSLYARGADSGNTGPTKNGVYNPFTTKQTVKRSTPDFSSSSLATPKDRLVAKRQGGNHAGVESKAVELERRADSMEVCKRLIDGFESVLVSVEVSITAFDKEVKSGSPAQRDFMKYVDSKVTQIRRDMDTAKTTKYKTKETMDALVSTATDLTAKLSDYKNDFSKTISTTYRDLKMNVGNIRSYARKYVEKGCVTVP
ncbi:hypothetical protein BGZ96_006278 [Linnemannia gamsii]|uniref:Uncharacterized protein n=1 Tax=Linnemannia gamsii TaxID=64522 RepID=A0ABQ7K423_9FUNG|nr:hypothetical protein BGZ96_006278 [Linnemannia gamsii]